MREEIDVMIDACNGTPDGYPGIFIGKMLL
jgi:hypothetical protein